MLTILDCYSISHCASSRALYCNRVAVILRRRLRGLRISEVNKEEQAKRNLSSTRNILVALSNWQNDTIRLTILLLICFLILLYYQNASLPRKRSSATPAGPNPNEAPLIGNAQQLSCQPRRDTEKSSSARKAVQCLRFIGLAELVLPTLSKRYLGRHSFEDLLPHAPTSD